MLSITNNSVQQFTSQICVHYWLLLFYFVLLYSENTFLTWSFECWQHIHAHNTYHRIIWQKSLWKIYKIDHILQSCKLLGFRMFSSFVNFDALVWYYSGKWKVKENEHFLSFSLCSKIPYLPICLVKQIVGLKGSKLMCTRNIAVRSSCGTNRTCDEFLRWTDEHQPMISCHIWRRR